MKDAPSDYGKYVQGNSAGRFISEEAAGSVVRRLIGHLDELATPERVIEEPGGEPFEIRDWLMLHCFREDHKLYDDIMALLSRARSVRP